MVRVRVTPTFETFWLLTRRFLLRRFGIFLAFMTIGPIGALLLKWAANPARISAVDLWLLFFPACAVALPLVTWNACRKQWNSSPAAREPKTYQFDEYGVTCVAESSRGEFVWAAVQRVTFEREYLAIWLGPRAAHVIPLDQLDPDQIDALMDLIRAHAPA